MFNCVKVRTIAVRSYTTVIDRKGLFWIVFITEKARHQDDQHKLLICTLFMSYIEYIIVEEKTNNTGIHNSMLTGNRMTAYT